MASPVSRPPFSRQVDPKYRHYKPKGLAVVRINGRDIYLGKYDSPQSWEKYYPVLAAGRLTGRAHSPWGSSEGPAVFALSVNELLLAFWRYAEVSSRRADGAPTAELDNLRLALRPLK